MDPVALSLVSICAGAALGVAVTPRLIRRRPARRTASPAVHAPSDDRPREVLDAITGLEVSELDPGGVVRLWSVGAERMFGYTSDEVIGTNVSRLQPPELAARRDFERHLAVAAQNGTHEFDTLRLRKDGRVIDVRVTLYARRDAEGKLLGYTKVSRDITREREADAERLLLEAAIDASADGVVLADPRLPDCPIVYATHGFFSFAGYAPEEVIGKNCRFLQGPGTSAEAVAGIRECVRNNRPFTGEVLNYRKDGTPFWNYLRITPIADARGEVIRLAGVQTDITRLKRIQQDLSTKNAELIRARDQLHAQAEALREQSGELSRAKAASEAASASKSQFLANMSHEIRTPLTAIIGFAELLTETTHTPEELSQHAAAVRRNGEHLLAMINDVLDLSKIEAGELTLERRPCRPVELAHRVVSMLKVRSDQKGITLSVDERPGVPEFIETDALRVDQILINLVGNAVKFTRHGGVRVVVRAVAPDDAAGVGRVAFDVIDTGVGMPEEHIERLFRVFSQGDASMTRRFGGTGLGLALSRSLARALGGDINVTSREAVGSTFTLTVPAAPASASAAAELVVTPAAGVLAGHTPLPPQLPAPAGASPALPTKGPSLSGTILVVEDGEDNQRLIATLLRQAGARVEIASDGLLGLVAFQRLNSLGTPPDLVLMDIQMPTMDGYEATAKLRELGFKGPILALTAHAMTEDRFRAKNAGCEDYLTKPIDRAKLIQTCRRWMATSPAGERSAAAVHTPESNDGSPTEPNPA
jgi:PAS domain S-box-containing protein